MLIKNAEIVTEKEILSDYDLLVKDGKIEKIAKNIKADCETIDAKGSYLLPGLIDIHTHGGFGGDFMDCEDESFESALNFHASCGVTSLLATSVTASVEQTVDMINFTREYMKKDNLPCNILGVHLEGPYLSLKNKGAQHESFILTPSKDDYSFILDNSDVVSRVTLAPELDGAEKMIKELYCAGIIVSGGHDDARYDSIAPAIDAGMSHCTHHWCAMSSVSMKDGVRSIGLVEAALLDDRLTVEQIADNHHITPEMVKLVFKNKGADKMCLVSDSLRAGGMPVGPTLYTLGLKTDPNAQKFIVSDGVARLPDGSRYAGSIQSVGQMLKNVVCDADISLVDGVKMVSLTPAKILGRDSEIGSIKLGKRADLCLFDKNLVNKLTVNGGRVVYRKED